MKFRVIGVVCCTAMLNGCVAAMMAPSLLAAGGSMAATDAWAKGMQNKANRQMATAQAIGGDLNYADIKVSKVQVNGDMVSWTAGTAEGFYRCSMQKGRTKATCKK